jgi:predicted  nucleic acid-binding Zn-ribbon protein
MLSDIEHLLRLQEIDLSIHQQELAKKELPETVKTLERTVETTRAAMETALAGADASEKGIRDLDEQVAAARESFERSQGRLNSIKTNREYDAVHAEIETQKNVIQTSEFRKKKLVDEAARQKAAAEAATAEYDRIKAENEPKIAELRANIASIDSVIAGIARERETVVPLIGKSTMRTYDQIKKRRKNARVVSPVNETRTCSVCHKVLEPQLMNEIKRAAKLIICQSCGSILIWTGTAGPTARPSG